MFYFNFSAFKFTAFTKLTIKLNLFNNSFYHKQLRQETATNLYKNCYLIFYDNSTPIRWPQLVQLLPKQLTFQ